MVSQHEYILIVLYSVESGVLNQECMHSPDVLEEVKGCPNIISSLLNSQSIFLRREVLKLNH